MSCSSDNCLSSFIEKEGVSLAEYGSSDVGFSKNNALTFLDVLKNKEFFILGIEIWRYKEDKFCIESASSWYSENLSLEKNFKEAKSFVFGTFFRDKDLLTIQFKK